MIILIGSQKGGCGKSTIAVNIAATLAGLGKDVVLVDADRQSTSSNWCADRAENSSLPVVHSVQKYDNIRLSLIDLDRRYEIVIVDAAGRDSRELRTGMTAAHLLILPFRPSQADLDTLPALQEIITQAKDFNPNLQSVAVFTLAPTNPKINEVQEAKEYLADYLEIALLETVICDRKIYRDVLGEGRGVTEADNQKAVDEIRNLIKEII